MEYTMRLYYICLLMAFFPLILFGQANLPLPECYHTYDEARAVCLGRAVSHHG